MRRYGAAAALVTCLLAGCRVSVDHDEDHGRADVQIRTPVGHVFVRTGEQLPDTGLAVYPGSVPMRHHREAESANVSVGNSRFGVKIAAANFFSDASPDAIVRYYRTAMRTHGEVTECHGNIDFRRSHPVCRGRMFSHSTQLAVGTEERHRLVSVQPRGNGSEYSLVYVQVNGES